ncbi:hypothetical protein [Carboxylicivirga sp. RSCT41]|uniref:hypothetical protein n=1 Tax=Carboxylicivirga agarovorans TaxID=3417570 RepID=UPI003D32AFA6
MKKTSILLLLIISIIGVMTLSGLKAAKQDKASIPANSYIIVRTLEIYGMKPSSMVTIYEDGTVEKTALGKLNAGKPEENLLIIHEKISEIESKGYTLESTTGGNSDNVICTTFIFKEIE